MDMMHKVEDRLNTIIGEYNRLLIENEELKDKLANHESNTVKFETEINSIEKEVEALLSKETFDELKY